MIYGTSHDTARDGAAVNTCVELLQDDARPFSRTPWRVTCRVTGERTRRTYHRTRNSADAQRDTSHSAALNRHGGKGTS